MHALLGHLLDWYSASLQSGGYPLIILLMAIESSVVPLPSEFIIPPAAYLAYSHGQMSPTGVVLAGALGSWIGAAAMYWAARIAGRPLVLSFAAWWTAWLSAIPSSIGCRWSIFPRRRSNGPNAGPIGSARWESSSRAWCRSSAI